VIERITGLEHTERAGNGQKNKLFLQLSIIQVSSRSMLLLTYVCSYCIELHVEAVHFSGRV